MLRLGNVRNTPENVISDIVYPETVFIGKNNNTRGRARSAVPFSSKQTTFWFSKFRLHVVTLLTWSAGSAHHSCLENWFLFSQVQQKSWTKCYCIVFSLKKMASGFRCLSLRASCPTTSPMVWTKSSNQSIDLVVSNRVYGATNNSSNGIQCYIDKPKVRSNECKLSSILIKKFFFFSRH